MHLLKKMGWQEGQGLGKNNDGAVEPIAPELKFDTKGLAALGEKSQTIQKTLLTPQAAPSSSSGTDGTGDDAFLANELVTQTDRLLNFSNPVSMLMEYCAKRKYQPPDFAMVVEEGPAHKPNFVMKVVVNGISYQPTISASNKKTAKALSAIVALQAFNLLPKDE